MSDVQFVSDILFTWISLRWKEITMFCSDLSVLKTFAFVFAHYRILSVSLLVQIIFLHEQLSSYFACYLTRRLPNAFTCQWNISAEYIAMWQIPFSQTEIANHRSYPPPFDSLSVPYISTMDAQNWSTFVMKTKSVFPKSLFSDDLQPRRLRAEISGLATGISYSKRGAKVISIYLSNRIFVIVDLCVYLCWTRFYSGWYLLLCLNSITSAIHLMKFEWFTWNVS